MGATEIFGPIIDTKTLAGEDMQRYTQAGRQTQEPRQQRLIGCLLNVQRQLAGRS